METICTDINLQSSQALPLQHIPPCIKVCLAFFYTYFGLKNIIGIANELTHTWSHSVSKSQEMNKRKSRIWEIYGVPYLNKSYLLHF